MNTYEIVNQNQSEVEMLLDERIPENIDRGDSADSNYERFLEYTSSLGYKMPVDSEEYFDFWNDIYLEIERQLEEFNKDNNSIIDLDF